MPRSAMEETNEPCFSTSPWSLWLCATMTRRSNFTLIGSGFELVEDTPLDDHKRWVVVRPPGQPQTALLLAKAAGDRQIAAVGAQTGGRVFLFLQTDDFARDYADYVRRGVVFEEKPRYETYRVVAVFRDLYGNRWDLIQPDRTV